MMDAHAISTLVVADISRGIGTPEKGYPIRSAWSGLP